MLCPTPHSLHDDATAVKSTTADLYALYQDRDIASYSGVRQGILSIHLFRVHIRTVD